MKIIIKKGIPKGNEGRQLVLRTFSNCVAPEVGDNFEVAVASVVGSNNAQLTAYVDGVAVGLMCGHVNKSYPYYKEKFYLCAWLYVDPAHRGKGIARKLCEGVTSFSVMNSPKRIEIAMRIMNIKASEVTHYTTAEDVGDCVRITSKKHMSHIQYLSDHEEKQLKRVK